MMYQEILDRIYNKISVLPDFPQTQVELLLEKLPAFSRDLPALCGLLPYGGKITAEAETTAAALMAMTLCLFIHDDTTRNRVFSREEAVLNGDFLFALAFSQLPMRVERKGAADIVRIYSHFNENRLTHKSLDKAVLDSKTALAFARADYGLLLKEIALAAAKDAQKDESEQETFARIAETVGTLWGIRAEAYDTGGVQEELVKTAKTDLAALPWAVDLTAVLDGLK